MTIADRKKQIRASFGDRLEIQSELALDRDLASAHTHANLDRIEDQLDSDEAVADENDLFDDE